MALAQAAGQQQVQFLQETLLAGSEAMSSFQKGFEPLPKGFPPGPEGDVAIDLVGDPLAFTTQAARKYGGIVGLRIAGQNVVLVSDPLLAKRVLIEDSKSYQKEGTAFFPNSSLTGNGLLVSDGEVWQRQRRLSNPAFRQAAVNSYSRAISQAAERLVHRRWRAGGARDVYADFNDLSLQALFGSEVPPALAADVREAIQDAFEYFGRRAAGGAAIPEWVPIPENLQFQASVTRLETLVYSIIETRREYLRHREGATASQDSFEGGLVDQLLQARDDGEGGDGEGMSDLGLRDEIMTLIIAGAETTGLSLTWIAAMLAEYPDVAERIRVEVNSVAPAPQHLSSHHYSELR
eukprot:gene1707-2365_t